MANSGQFLGHGLRDFQVVGLSLSAQRYADLRLAVGAEQTATLIGPLLYPRHITKAGEDWGHKTIGIGHAIHLNGRAARARRHDGQLGELLSRGIATLDPDGEVLCAGFQRTGGQLNILGL